LTHLNAEVVGLSETVVQVQILIIEADDDFRRKISKRLHLEGVMVFEACDESEAMDIALNRNIDVVLLGENVVGQSRLQYLKFIKATSPSTEVILMTPSSNHSLPASIEAMKLGAFDELPMPLDIEILLNRIHAAGKQKKGNEEAMRPYSPGEAEGRPVSSGNGPVAGERKRTRLKNYRSNRRNSLAKQCE
jgi:DNA-binding NtrC family response regulator